MQLEAMQFVLFIFVIGVLNLCLGYGICVFLGYGPPGLPDAWEALRPAPSPEECEESAIEESPNEVEPESAPVPEAPSPAEPEEEMEEEAVESEVFALDALRQAVDKATSSLAGLSARLNRGEASQYGRTAWSFVGTLQEICEPYMRHLSDAYARLFGEVGDLGQATALGEEIEGIILAQTAQLETTLGNLQYMDFNSGASAAVARLKSETENTLSLAHSLQKALEAVPAATEDLCAKPAVA